LRGKDDAVLAKLLKEGYSDLDVVKTADEAFLTGVCGMMKERATFLADIPVEGAYFFTAPTEFDEKTTRKKWKDESAELMKEWTLEFAGIEEYTTENIEQTFKRFLEAKDMGIGAVLPLFRLLVTGKGMGPSMFSIAELLGKEETLARMEAGINTLG
jgi:glutamyl-tRNA synthetase